MPQAEMTDLAGAIEELRLVDTHEHLMPEAAWLETPRDILQDLFLNYVPADLVVAGAAPAAVERLVDAGAGDVEGRFDGVREAWEAVRHTGYGEAVGLIASEIYGLEELTPDALAGAQARLNELQQPGEMLRLLRDVGRLDHVQIDDLKWECHADPSGPDFFLHDLSWYAFCNGDVDAAAIFEETGIELRTLDDLRAAMASIFERYAPYAIAVKSQHAYNRTLRWQERSDEEAARALGAVLQAEGVGGPTRWTLGDLSGGGVDEQTRLVLGDWCWARGVELASEHNLPFKLHTGYYAGHSRMPADWIPAGNLCPLLARYPNARFVLMHIAYPYADELVAIAKHYPNVWVDLCWAWSIDPYASVDFVRRFLHAAPINKLFAFGGDTGSPTNSVAYSIQARRWLTRALEAEVVEDLLTEQEAIRVAQRIMRENQYMCFEVDGTRAALASEAGAREPAPAEASA